MFDFARRGNHSTRARQRRSQSLSLHRHDYREDSAGNRGEEHGVHDGERAEQTADRRHQLHVAGAGCAEHMPGKHQHQANHASEKRRADRELSPKPNAASASPEAAIVPVRTFGIRRVRRSTTVAAINPTASTANDALESLSNDLPEHRVDGVSDRRHGAECDDADERAEQPVLEKILTLLLAAQSSRSRGVSSEQQQLAMA